MDTPTPEDIAFLKRIRGRFAPTKAAERSLLFYAFLMGVCGPILFSCLLLHDGIPAWPLDGNQWTAVILTPSSLVLGWFLWRGYGSVYEFTDMGVILWCRGRKRRGIQFSEIEKMDVRRDQYGSSLILEGNGRRFPVPLDPSLKAYLDKMNAEQGPLGQDKV
jgi:hypothetical protein